MPIGRRASHILNISREPLKNSNENDAIGVWLLWDETKTNQGEQMVFIPHPLSDIAKEAVETARELTSEYVNIADESIKDKLFLKFYGGIKPITYENLLTWLNGREHMNSESFVDRYKIMHNGELYKIKTHGFRHTRASQLRIGGAGHGTVQNDLKHLTSDMTGVYIHADEALKEEIEELRDKQELSGSAVSLLENKKVRLDEFTNEELDLWEKQGMYFNPTMYGYCVLPIESGICPSGDPCWTGREGCGCQYHVFCEKHTKQIEEDVSVVKKRLDKAIKEKPNSPIVDHYKAIINRYENIIKSFKN